ncbi:MAG: hypothetical protein A4S09_10185 [Proteobacteria bacterium SG_bin7]|nr:MAG: hypothetical protein A4S09_10185 [Proteobacteria bacterium SG_bin7]
MALAYFTIYHNYRQFYGFTKWYEKLNQRKCFYSGTLVQLLCLIPFFLFHFRSGVALGYMTDRDFLVIPNRDIFHWGSCFYVLTLLVWIVLEIDLLVRKSVFEANRVLSIFVPSILYGYGFLKGHVFVDIVFPLLIAHAISYFAVMALSLRRLKPTKYTFMKALGIVVITAFVFGSSDYIFETLSLSPYTDYVKDSTVWGALAISVLVTPVICHYVFDAWIWRYSHPRSKVIFTAQ